MKIDDFLDYIREAKSKATFKNYTQGLKKFTAWYGKDENTILKERFEDLQTTDQNKRKRFNREIEKFHRHLKNLGHPQNTAVAYTEGIRQLFRYFDMDIKNLPSEVTRKIVTVKDYTPKVNEYRDMFNCGNVLDRTIISMALDLAWRIGDFVKIRKDMLPNLEQETPIPFDLITEKEEVISKSFLSAQTVQLLKTYLKTLPKENPYLFHNRNGSHYDPEAIGKRLKVLAKKAKIHIPKGKRLRFHCFRKRFLSECANLKIDINTAKIMVGKSVSKDMLTYLSEVEHKKAFEEVHERLQLTEVKAVINAKDSEIEALNKRIGELEIMNKGLIEMLARNAKALGIGGDLSEGTAKATIIERIKELGKQAVEKEQAEYKKLIESNNNNNNH